MATYRIKKGVRPYPRRKLEATRETETHVSGHVVLTYKNTAEYTYRRDELDAVAV